MVINVLNAIISFIGDHLANLLTLGVLFIAYRAFKVTAKSFEEQNRPYITANIEKGDSPFHIYLIIRNNGNRGAQDVSMTFTPPLRSQMFQNMPEVNEFTKCMYAFIAPQQTIKTTFDLTTHRFAKGVVCDNKISIDINYKCAKKSYTDKYLIDIDYIRNQVGPNESDVKMGFEQIDKTLKKIVVSTEKLAENVRKND